MLVERFTLGIERDGTARQGIGKGGLPSHVPALMRGKIHIKPYLRPLGIAMERGPETFPECGCEKSSDRSGGKWYRN